MGYQQILPNYAGMAQDAYDKGRQRSQQRGLESLSSQYFAQQGNPLLSEMAKASPDAAVQFQKVQNGDEDRQKAELGELAGYLLSVPEEQRPQVWQTQIAPRVGKLIPGADKEPYGPHVADIAQWAVEQYGRGGEKIGPMNLSPGAELVDRTGRVIHANTNFAPARPYYDQQRGMLIYPDQQQGPDASQGAQNAPQGVPDAMPPQGGPNDDMGTLLSLGQMPGVTPTSGLRSPDHNAEVGGKPNSQHLAGTAMDYVIPEPLKAQFRALVAKNPDLEVIDEGDHMHVQKRRSGAGGGGGGGVGTRTVQVAPPMPPKGAAPPSGYQWNTDRSGLVPIPGGPADKGRAASAPGDTTKTGEAYLATLPAEMRGLVKAIAAGDSPAPSASSRSPQAQALLQAVYLYDPSASSINLNARGATRRDFTAGKSAQNLRSLNQAIGHLGVLRGQISGVAGHSIPGIGSMVNKAENAYDRASGKPGITNYEQTAEALAGELTQVFRGNAGAEADIVRNLEHLSAAQSVDQKNAAVKNIVALLNSRIEELGQQYSQGMGKTTDPYSLLNKHAAEVLRQIQEGDKKPDNKLSPAEQAELAQLRARFGRK